MIASPILFCNRIDNVLFDPGSTCSYMSVRFASDFEMFYDILDDPIHVSTPVGESLIVTHLYRACLFQFMGFQTSVYFVIFDVVDFDIISDISWFSPHYVVLN